jgi:hypothetical protein
MVLKIKKLVVIIRYSINLASYLIVNNIPSFSKPKKKFKKIGKITYIKKISRKLI